MEYTLEQSGKTSFTNYVANIQENWTKQKSNPLTEISQAIDLPTRTSEAIYNTILDNLPLDTQEGHNYKEEILRDHPTPIYAVGLLTDKRALTPFQSHFSPQFPERYSKEERIAWRKGLLLLDEYATDSLAYGVERRLIQRAFGVNLAENIMKMGSFSAMVYSNPTSDRNPMFTQELIHANLTDDLTSLNEYIQKYLNIESVDELAITIGSSSNIKSKSVEMLSRTIIKVANKNRLIFSTATGGFVDRNKPGVIQINMLPYATIGIISIKNLTSMIDMVSGNLNFSHGIAPYAIPAGFSAANLAMLLAGVYNQLHAIVHETCHYITQDHQTMGLTPVLPAE